MTHPLSEELRKLEDEHQHPLVGWEQRLVDALRRAADEIERMQIKLEAVAVSHQNIVEYANDALAERDEWKKKCSVLYIAELTAERDELRRQVKEGDELRQEYLDDWQKEVAELRRQLDVCQRNCEDLKLTVLHVTEAAERAEAQAARYREALEHIEGICPRDWLPWITKALCEPETGSQG